jgi:hypothetical protein
MAIVVEGSFVMGMTKEGMIHGMVEHIMVEGGTLGTLGSEYALVSMPPENPAMSVRIYKEEDGSWEPTAYSIGMMYKDAEVIDINNHSMESEESDDTDAYDNSIGKSHSCAATSSLDKAYEGCGCPTCKELNVNCENCPVCIANSYMSDDEDMDKWDNVTKACWVGYTQRGMKDKDGRMVPNCVPVSKSEEEDDMEKAKKPNYGAMIKPRSGGSSPANPKLYARVVQAAKDKFDVYPSAVANSWVVQEYKRRGGTYKSDEVSTQKSIWNGFFDPKGFNK